MNNTAATLAQLTQVISRVISLALTFVGTASLMMILYGGFLYLNAGSDKGGADRARQTLTYAILGLVLAIAAWLILSLISSFLGLPGLLIFEICFTPGGCL